MQCGRHDVEVGVELWGEGMGGGGAAIVDAPLDGTVTSMRLKGGVLS